MDNAEMIIASKISEVRTQVKLWKKEGLSVGFVPTMGYLHEGHESLINRSISENDRTVVSIFVNPMQFGASEDLSSYPRDFERDSLVLERNGADMVFHPEPHEMYADSFCSYINVDHLSEQLCGKSRPNHFRGVCTVVAKLFNIVTPDRAYFGQKDAQQLAVIKRMVNDLSIDVEIIACPIVREDDGLAKSSRNTYLNKEERKAALALSQAISIGKHMLKDGETDADSLINAMRIKISTQPLARIDYIEAVDIKTMKPVRKLCSGNLIALAVFIGDTRLIDNFTIGEVSEI